MAPAGTNPKIEELRFKVKTDPKSRLFYPLAEELRKIGQFAEAEQVLRAGLSTHATYLSAWVVLGRVLREQQKHSEAVDALTKALELDRGNVVVARLLAETYLDLGEKIEALKKYKLVHALMPGDDEIESIIHRLESEVAPAPVSIALADPPAEDLASADVAPMAGADDGEEAEPPSDQDDVFDTTYSGLKREAEVEFTTGDAEPMSAEHTESPFEEADPGGYSANAFDVEQPPGIHLASAPMEADLATPIPSFDLPSETLSSAQEPEAEDSEASDAIAPGFITGSFDANVPPSPAAADDFARTITMADLYANQGLVDEARDIYEDVLARDPGNAAVRAKLEALDTQADQPSDRGPQTSGKAPDEDPWAAAGDGADEPSAVSPEARGVRPEVPSGKVRKLEDWLSKVKRSGAEGV